MAVLLRTNINKITYATIFVEEKYTQTRRFDYISTSPTPVAPVSATLAGSASSSPSRKTAGLHTKKERPHPPG